MNTANTQEAGLSILPRGEPLQNMGGQDCNPSSTPTRQTMGNLPENLRITLNELSKTHKEAYLHLRQELVQQGYLDSNTFEDGGLNTDNVGDDGVLMHNKSGGGAEIETTQEGSQTAEIPQKQKEVQCMNWAAVLKRNNTTGFTKLKYEQPTVVEGKRVVQVNVADFEKRIEECEQLVVGRFVGKRLAFGYVKEILSRTWGTSNFEMNIHGEHTFLFKFNDDATRSKVLEIGSIHIASRLFILRPWAPELESEANVLRTIPIWVTMKKIPLFLWNPEGLQKIASFIGNPIMLDKATEEKTRLSFARVCVEIDITSQLSKTIPVAINGKQINVDVEYSWIPAKCNVCAGFGHNKNSCTKSKPERQMTAQVWRAKSNKEDNPKDDEGWITASGRHSFKPRNDMKAKERNQNDPSNVASTSNEDEMVIDAAESGNGADLPRSMEKEEEQCIKSNGGEGNHDDKSVSGDKPDMVTADTEGTSQNDGIAAVDSNVGAVTRTVETISSVGAMSCSLNTISSVDAVAHSLNTFSNIGAESNTLNTISKLRDKVRNMGVEQLSEPSLF